MTSISAQARSRCPIGLFERQEAKIAVLTKAINAARGAAEKAPNARMLSDAVNVLLNCQDRDQANQQCSLCQSFSELRLKIADLVTAMGNADSMLTGER